MSLRISIILFFPLLFASCDEDAPASVLFNPPKCTITHLSPVDIPDFGFATMDVTVKNTGKGATAYQVTVFVKLKRGNFIVDEAYGYYGTLEQGESKIEELWFTDLENDSDYTSKEVSLEWYDASGNFHD